ncbi:MAG: hypothetical protein LBL75_03445 [Rickettsiales bacterium]|nr:hypothetical protein [Rickettsiales bacterium]
MKKILVLFLMVLVAGCALQTKHRGYVFPDDLDSAVAGIKTTKTLTEKFGSPLAKTMYGSDVWIWYGADENYHGPFPLTYDNKIVMLAAVDGNVVRDIKILRDDDLPDVKIADGETTIPAAVELNAVEEMFKNVGRFKPAGLGQ